MPPEVTPDILRQAQFRSAFRGFDPAEVESMLHAAAGKLEQLDAERRKLAAELAEAPGQNLESEFDEIGREVSAILQSAREAAESLREKATADAARWRSEAMEESEITRKEAAADAEALRRDAWVTSSDMLDQSMTKAEAMRANAERDVLTVMGEAEREAHRLTSSARREAEDLVRNATMDAEKIIADATSRRDEIIDGANRQAATAQERTRALEQRRDELMEELENVRSTLSRLEGSLEERREAMDLTASEPSSSVKVVHPPADAKAHWELGETVRVVPSGSEPHEEDLAEVVEPDPVVEDPEPVAETPAIEVVEREVQPEGADEAASTPAEPAPEPTSTASDTDDLSALFASLRGGDAPEASREEDAPVPEPSVEGDDVAEPEAAEETEAPEAEDGGTDWIEVRDERLIPITNRALRGVKKAMTEVQNVALDSLRTDDEWRPDEKSIAESVHAEVVAVWTESFAAGHAVAEEMTGSKLKRPPTPATQADGEFGSDLAAAVTSALEAAGEGPRERQSAASRVFRVWRSDEAERRIRDIAIAGYQRGIEESRKVASGV